MNTLERNEANALRSSAGTPIRNTILLRIPQKEFDTLEPYLEFTSLCLGTFLQRQHEPVDAVYFVNSGLAAMIVETQDGRSVEVGVSGREDLIGLPVLAGLAQLTYHIVVQVSGDAFRVDAGTLKRLLPQLPELHRILTQRLAIRSMQMAQYTACNRLHNVKQRLARWLLATLDRLDSHVVAITHDFLARMIGTDRPTVSVALASLQRDGAITGTRGAISLADRQKLYRLACECYEIFQQFNRDLGLAPVPGITTS
jgi:CRP-like cAMP-binding protein